MATVNEIITKFSFKGALTPQKTFNENLKKSVKLLAGFQGAIYASSGLVYRWINSISQAIDPTIQLSRETGVAVETIQELGYAASQNGSSLDAVQSSITGVNKSLGEFVRTGGGPAAEVAIQLGLNLRKSSGEVKKASDVMLELNGKLARFSKAEQSDILSKLGIDGSMIQLLNKSDEAISSLMKKARDLGVINKEQADQLASYNDANMTLRFGLKSLQNQIALGMTPVLKDLIGGFADWLSSNKELVKNMATSFGKGILVALGFVDRMKYVVLGLAGAVWILNGGLVTLLSPVLLIAVGIAAAILIVDDLIVAFNGGKSVIRDFIKEWTGFDIGPALVAGVEAVKSFASYVMGLGGRLLNGLGNIFSGVWDIWNGDFSSGFDKLLSGANEWVNVFKDIFTGAFSFIGDQISKIIPDWIKDAYRATSGAASSAGSAVSSAYDSASSFAQGLFSDGGTTNTSSSNVNQTNDIKIYSSDPVAAGQAVADFSSKQLRDTREFYKRGGR